MFVVCLCSLGHKTHLHKGCYRQLHGGFTGERAPRRCNCGELLDVIEVYKVNFGHTGEEQLMHTILSNGAVEEPQDPAPLPAPRSGPPGDRRRRAKADDAAPKQCAAGEQSEGSKHVVPAEKNKEEEEQESETPVDKKMGQQALLPLGVAAAAIAGDTSQTSAPNKQREEQRMTSSLLSAPLGPMSEQDVGGSAPKGLAFETTGDALLQRQQNPPRPYTPSLPSQQQLQPPEHGQWYHQQERPRQQQQNVKQHQQEWWHQEGQLQQQTMDSPLASQQKWHWQQSEQQQQAPLRQQQQHQQQQQPWQQLQKQQQRQQDQEQQQKQHRQQQQQQEWEWQRQELQPQKQQEQQQQHQKQQLQRQQRREQQQQLQQQQLQQQHEQEQAHMQQSIQHPLGHCQPDVQASAASAQCAHPVQPIATTGDVSGPRRRRWGRNLETPLPPQLPSSPQSVLAQQWPNVEFHPPPGLSIGWW